MTETGHALQLFDDYLQRTARDTLRCVPPGDAYLGFL